MRDMLRPRAAVLPHLAPEVPHVRGVRQASRRETHAEPRQGHHGHTERAVGGRAVALSAFP